MRITIDITKTRFFILLGTILLLGAGVFVYAYNSNGLGGNAAVMGHSVDEVNWSQKIPENVHIDGNQTIVFGDGKAYFGSWMGTDGKSRAYLSTGEWNNGTKWIQTTKPGMILILKNDSIEFWKYGLAGVHKRLAVINDAFGICDVSDTTQPPICLRDVQAQIGNLQDP